MIMAKCDRCGTEEETSGRAVEMVINPLLRKTETRLPAGWHRVAEPVDDERIEWPRRELCPACVTALRKFFEGDGAVPGLLSVETLDEKAEEFRDAVRAQRRGCIAHGGPDCVCPPEELSHDTPECPFCPRPGYQLTNDHVREVHPDRWDAWAELEGVDPRPNLTERARKMASGQRCVCAGAGFGTEDCPMHHPNGVAEGTHLPCQMNESGECPGIFRRGMFPEHMERWHGVKIAPGSKPCPFCPEIVSGMMKIGQHIARAHPGDWQAWNDSGQRAG